MPRLYLAVDNCFASKRWTEPSEWARLVHELGLRYVEAGADTEHDPLYLGPDYYRRWLDLVREAERTWDLRVANLYSGHGTYATLGLAHWDRSAATHLRDHWLKAVIDHAAALDAGLGFFMHAFPQGVLDEPAAYYAARRQLVEDLAHVTLHAAKRMSRPIGLEQMYAPHQIPWTIRGTQTLLDEVSRRAREAAGTADRLLGGSTTGTETGTRNEQSPGLYTTIDTGHASGQAAFSMPSADTVDSAVDAMREGRWQQVPWLGASAAYAAVREAARDASEESRAAARDKVLETAAAHPYLFAEATDADPYEWLRRLGPYSPIVHLQQSDGRRSGHLPFTARHNESGVITGERVIAALSEGFSGATPESSLLEPVDEIYLTLEVFLGTASHPRVALEELRESVAYWRQFVPEDGMNLHDAMARLDHPPVV